MILLPTDFKELLKSLNSNNVKYLVIGGYAVAHYGYVRSTNDIDLWISRDPENALKVVKSLEEFGFPGCELNIQYFTEPEQITRMGYPPLRIEIMTTISGVVFEDAFSNRVLFNYEGIEIPIINLEDLKKNKKSAARNKDLNDLENI